MQYRALGNTGLRVSEIGHGLWGMGDWSGSTDRGSADALSTSLALGCNVYDSAAAYGAGKSDALLGGLVQAHPSERIVTAGKVPPKNWTWPATKSEPFAEVFPYDYVMACARDSRAKMNVEQIDLIQLHVWDDAWASDPTFERVARGLKASGVARSFGLSLNRWEPWNGLAAIRTGLVDAVQVIYNIFDQAPEDELFPMCIERNAGVIARVPLDEGSLGGTLTLATTFPPDDWRSSYFGPKNLAPTVARVEALKKIVPTSMTLPELALRFILEHPAVSTIIVGMRSPQNIRRNAAVSDGTPLDPALVAQLRLHRWDRKPAPWSD